jgi:hypothetical protein
MGGTQTPAGWAAFKRSDAQRSGHQRDGLSNTLMLSAQLLYLYTPAHDILIMF